MELLKLVNLNWVPFSIYYNRLRKFQIQLKVGNIIIRNDISSTYYFSLKYLKYVMHSKKEMNYKTQLLISYLIFLGKVVLINEELTKKCVRTTLLLKQFVRFFHKNTSWIQFLYISYMRYQIFQTYFIFIQHE